MAKKFDHLKFRDKAKPPAPRKDCRTCDNKRQVRVSKPRRAQGKTARQQYDIVTVRCPDC